MGAFEGLARAFDELVGVADELVGAFADEDFAGWFWERCEEIEFTVAQIASAFASDTLNRFRCFFFF